MYTLHESWIQAAAPREERPIECTADVALIEAAEGEDRGAKIEIMAYNGGVMNVPGWGPLVIDLSGLETPGSVPLLADHRKDLANVLGAGKASIEDGRLSIAGSLVSGVAAADHVRALARGGVKLQASVGVVPTRFEHVREGQKIEANGRTLRAPQYGVVFVRAGRLREVSVLPIGADPGTRVHVAAGETGDQTMGFEQWVRAQGWDPATLTDQQRKTLEAAYQAEIEAAGESGDGGGDGGQAGTPAPQPTPPAAPTVNASADGNGDDPVTAYRLQIAAERERITAIEAAAAGHPEISAQAIREGWTVERAELQVLRASRPQTPAGHVRGGEPLSEHVLEAAVCQAGGLPDVERQYDERTLEAADRRYRQRLGLRQLIIEAAWAMGFTGHGFGDLREAHNWAFGLIQAAGGASGFSTLSLPGILSNVANKFLRAGFESVEQTWRAIALIGAVNDFKEHSRYTLTGGLEFQDLAPQGELKHGKLGEEEYKIQAETKGVIYGISRKDLINDDLGALTAVPRRIGRGGALRLNTDFWKVFLDDSDFFPTDKTKKNYVDGADSALSVSGLQLAEQAFLEQTDPDGYPLALAPKVLLVPPPLKFVAEQLMSSTELNETTTANKPKPTRNVYAGRYSAVHSAYLTAAKVWYLIGDPQDLPLIEVAFLNGAQTPVVESSEAAFNVLGSQMRGYWDYGVAKQEPRAGVKVKGEA